MHHLPFSAVPLLNNNIQLRWFTRNRPSRSKNFEYGYCLVWLPLLCPPLTDVNTCVLHHPRAKFLCHIKSLNSCFKLKFLSVSVNSFDPRELTVDCGSCNSHPIVTTTCRKVKTPIATGDPFVRVFSDFIFKYIFHFLFINKCYVKVLNQPFGT